MQAAERLLMVLEEEDLDFEASCDQYHRQRTFVPSSPQYHVDFLVLELIQFGIFQISLPAVIPAPALRLPPESYIACRLRSQ